MYRHFCRFLPVLVLVGCGRSGSARVEVSGVVTYRNKPVPAGVVFLEPRAGVAGPQGLADIVDGKFRTRPDWGPVAGPHTVRVQFFVTPGTSPEATHPVYGEGGTLKVEEKNYATKVVIPTEGDAAVRIDIPDEIR